MVKKIFRYLLVFVAIFAFTINVKAFDRDYNIKDYSHTLTYTELESLKDKAEEYYNEKGMEVIILIYDYGYSDATLERMARAYFDERYSNSYGSYLALDIKDADLYGYMFHFDASDDYYSEHEKDLMLSDIRKVKNNGTYAICNQFIDSSIKYADEEKNYTGLVMLIILPFVIAGITIAILIKKNKMVQKATQASAYLDKSNVVFTSRQDRYITTTTSRVRINTSSSSGGGSHGGGSHGMSGGRGGRL